MKNNILDHALTFDDVLLIPAKSNILPKDANVSSRLTKNIPPLRNLRNNSKKICVRWKT